MAVDAYPELHLTLFVDDSAPSSLRAQRQLEGWFALNAFPDGQLDIVDVRADPALAEKERVLATPSLVRHSPLPRRKLVGDLDDWSGVARTLDLDDALGRRADEEAPSEPEGWGRDG